MNTKLKKIRCIQPSKDTGDLIKLELTDETGSQSYTPPSPFKSNDTRQFDASFPAFGHVAKLKLYLQPDNLVGEDSLHVSSPSHGEKIAKFQNENADYEVTYEVI
jgi:hypothetical protein